MKKKICGSCKVEKNYDEFHKNPAKKMAYRVCVRIAEKNIIENIT